MAYEQTHALPIPWTVDDDPNAYGRVVGRAKVYPGGLDGLVLERETTRVVVYWDRDTGAFKTVPYIDEG